MLDLGLGGNHAPQLLQSFDVATRHELTRREGTGNANDISPDAVPGSLVLLGSNNVVGHDLPRESTARWQGSTSPLAEPLRPERCGVNGRRLPGHHLGDEPAADGPERQAKMMVGEIEPEAGLARHRPDDGAHVGQAGTAAEPGPCVLPGSERKHLSRERL